MTTEYQYHCVHCMVGAAALQARDHLRARRQKGRECRCRWKTGSGRRRQRRSGILRPTLTFPELSFATGRKDKRRWTWASQTSLACPPPSRSSRTSQSSISTPTDWQPYLLKLAAWSTWSPCHSARTWSRLCQVNLPTCRVSEFSIAATTGWPRSPQWSTNFPPSQLSTWGSTESGRSTLSWATSPTLPTSPSERTRSRLYQALSADSNLW